MYLHPVAGDVAVGHLPEKDRLALAILIVAQLREQAAAALGELESWYSPRASVIRSRIMAASSTAKMFPDDLLERVRRVLEPGEQGWPEQTEEL